MKKVLLFLLTMLLACSSLFSMIQFECEMSYDDKAWLIETFHATYHGRGDSDIRILGLDESEGTVDLSYSINGEERLIKAPSRDEMLRLLDRAMHSEEALFLDDEGIYFTSGGIIASRSAFEPGRLVVAKDKEGETRGVLMTREKTEDGNLFTPWMKRKLLPGLRLEKGYVGSIDMMISTPFRDGNMSASVTYRNLIGLENIFFKAGVRYTMEKADLHAFHFSLGMESRASLSSLFSSGFTLIEDGAVFASTELLLGYDGKFSVAGVFSCGYEHMMSPAWYWRVGVEKSSLIKGASMYLSLGALV